MEIASLLSGGVDSSVVVYQLKEMGYTNIKELGGILKWPHEIIHA